MSAAISRLMIEFKCGTDCRVSSSVKFPLVKVAGAFAGKGHDNMGATPSVHGQQVRLRGERLQPGSLLGNLLLMPLVLPHPFDGPFLT